MREIKYDSLPNFPHHDEKSSSSQFKKRLLKISFSCSYLGTTVAQWLRCYATNRWVAGSTPAGVSGFFIDIKSFRFRPGVDSASNRNEYQEYFLGVKAAGA